MMKYFNIYLISFVLLLSLMFSTSAQAQMFSVEEESRGFELPSISVYLGMEMADFDYTGLPGSLGAFQYEFSGPLLRLLIETPNINLYLGSGGTYTGLEGASYFQAGIKGRYLLRLVNGNIVRLRVPFQLQSDITTVTNTEALSVNAQFQQGAMLFGTGINMEVRPVNGFRFEINAAPGAGISFSSGGTFAGNMGSFEAGLRTYFDNLFDTFGITAGYEYRNRAYDVDRERYDYDLMGHSILIGVTF